VFKRLEFYILVLENTDNIELQEILGLEQTPGDSEGEGSLAY